MCLLTGFLFTVLIPDKRAKMVINAYLRNVYAITGGSKYILSDHGTEFTSKTFKEIIDRLQLTHLYISEKPKRQLNPGKITCLPKTRHEKIESQ